MILLLTEKGGNIRTWVSAGTVGFKGSRKTQPVAAERAAEELAKRALKLGYSTVEVKLTGMGSNKQYAVQALRAAGLNITALMDVTPIPYNGCRPKKRRRV
jgi:small subunit ribosomal protein S11